MWLCSACIPPGRSVLTVAEFAGLQPLTAYALHQLRVDFADQARRHGELL